MFVDEANLLARLHHPAIVRTIEVGVDNGQRYIAMELLLGMTLATVYEACVTRGLRLEPDLVAWIGARIAEGLQHAHELRGRHRGARRAHPSRREPRERVRHVRRRTSSCSTSAWRRR